MSLLIDALKKHRLTSTPSLAQVGGDALQSASPGRTKKIILIGLIAVIVIVLTATVSFLIFKHIEMAQMQKIKAMMEARSGGAAKGPGASEGSGEIREKLMQRMQQKNENEPVSSVSALPSEPVAATSNVASTSVSDATTDTASSTASASPAAGGESLRSRLAARRGTQNGGGDSASTPADTPPAPAPISTFPSESASSQDNTDTSNDSGDDSSNSGSSDDSSSNSSSGVKVDIQEVADQQGANNPIYQKALGFMQINQYDKALALLVNNDNLMLTTQGLSALLLARIYLATGEYELADHVLDRALLLHAGSEMDLLALRAQALFMQRKYQESIDLLASQSPDLGTSPGYYALLADAYMHLDQASNAVSVFQQIVARFPDSPDYWLGLAVAYQKTGDAPSAMVAYRRAAQLSPNDPQVTLFINQQLQALQVT